MLLPFLVVIVQGAPRDLSALTGWYNNQEPVRFFLDNVPEYDACIQQHAKSLNQYRDTKHGGEVWWLEQLRQSPWRTHFPSDADIHVVPLHPGWNARRHFCRTEFMNALTSIQAHPHHRRVLMSTDFKTKIKHLCPKCEAITLHKDVPAPLVGHLHRPTTMCSLTHEYTQRLRNQNYTAFNSRPNTFYFAGQADKRRAYRSRVQVRRVFKGMGLPFVTVNPGYTTADDFCEQSVSTRFALHVRGDTPVSSRQYEGIDAGSVVVFLSDKIHDGWLPGRHVPWRDITLSIREHQTDDELERALRRIAELPPVVVNRMRNGMRTWSPSLLWGAPNSVVAEMLLLDLMR